MAGKVGAMKLLRTASQERAVQAWAAGWFILGVLTGALAFRGSPAPSCCGERRLPPVPHRPITVTLYLQHPSEAKPVTEAILPALEKFATEP